MTDDLEQSITNLYAFSPFFRNGIIGACDGHLSLKMAIIKILGKLAMLTDEIRDSVDCFTLAASEKNKIEE